MAKKTNTSKTNKKRLGILTVDVARGEIVLTAGEKTNVDPQRLLNLLKQGGPGLRVAPNHKIYAPAPKRFEPATLFAAVRGVLANLGG